MKLRNRALMFVAAGAVAFGGLAGCATSGDSSESEKSTIEETTSEAKEEESKADETTSTTKNTAVTSVEDNTQLNAEEMDTAVTAAEELNSGNSQYLKGNASMDVSSELREELVNGQKPHTVVITCSDSRVPPELIFNADLGELFTIRTAGNIVGEYEIGSVEYAVDHLGSQLVLVMGHSSCGAVGAAVEGHASGNVESIVEEIIPSVKEAEKTESDKTAIASKAEELNVENTIKKLRESETIKTLEDEGKIKIVGAKYDIETGKVTYFK